MNTKKICNKKKLEIRNIQGEKKDDELMSIFLSKEEEQLFEIEALKNLHNTKRITVYMN